MRTANSYGLQGVYSKLSGDFNPQNSAIYRQFFGEHYDIMPNGTLNMGNYYDV